MSFPFEFSPGEEERPSLSESASILNEIHYLEEHIIGFSSKSSNFGAESAVRELEKIMDAVKTIENNINSVFEVDIATSPENESFLTEHLMVLEREVGDIRSIDLPSDGSLEAPKDEDLLTHLEQELRKIEQEHIKLIASARNSK